MSTYSIEESKSGRAKCKRCKGTIEKGELRIGTHSDNGEYAITTWSKVGCFKMPRRFKTEYGDDDKGKEEFLQNEVEDHTEDHMLSNEDALMAIVMEMGSNVVKATKKRKKKDEEDGGGEDDDGPKSKIKKQDHDVIKVEDSDDGGDGGVVEDNGTIPQAFVDSVNGLDWDLSSKQGIKQSSSSLVKLLIANDSPVAVLDQNDKENKEDNDNDNGNVGAIKKVKMAVGSIILSNRDKSASEILNLIVEKYGLKEINEKKKAKSAENAANECTVAANGKVYEVMKELSDRYFKDKNTNAGITYRKVYTAVKDLAFEITADNAKGLGTGKKTKVDGIGKGSAEKIKEFLVTGKIAKLEEKRAAQD